MYGFRYWNRNILNDGNNIGLGNLDRDRDRIRLGYGNRLGNVDDVRLGYLLITRERSEKEKNGVHGETKGTNMYSYLVKVQEIKH